VINPFGVAVRGYFGDTLSISVDGYIYPVGDAPFVSDFVQDFVGNFVGNFVDSYLTEDND